MFLVHNASFRLIKQHQIESKAFIQTGDVQCSNIKHLSKEFIKPSRPTLETSRTLILSLLDHFAPPVYVRIMFFYLNESMDSPTRSVPNKTISTGALHSNRATTTKLPCTKPHQTGVFQTRKNFGFR
ncbi:hypothetical protein Droror1_Dr00017639 [Drosera rotundifolia]